MRCNLPLTFGSSAQFVSSCSSLFFQRPCPLHTAGTSQTIMSAVREKETGVIMYLVMYRVSDFSLCVCVFARSCVSVIRDPPAWEVGVYLLGFMVLLGIVGANLWKLWRSGSFPAPSPYPNFNYRYLQEKYGTSYSEVRQKVIDF